MSGFDLSALDPGFGAPDEPGREPVPSGSWMMNRKIDRKAFGSLQRASGLQQRSETAILWQMIKETIPELQTLSPAEKFALAIELWDELASNPDEFQSPTSS